MQLSTVESTLARMSEPGFVHLGLAIWGHPALAHSQQVHVAFQQSQHEEYINMTWDSLREATHVNMDQWRYPGCKASTFIFRRLHPRRFRQDQQAGSRESGHPVEPSRHWIQNRKHIKYHFQTTQQDGILYWLCFVFFLLQLLINCILICGSPAPIEKFGLWLLCQSDDSSCAQTASLVSWCRRITFKLLWPFRSRHDT